MTVFKSGDRVRVTYEGVMDRDGWATIDGSINRFPVYTTLGAKIEVLSRLPYRNHDTTDIYHGDVARDQHGCVLVRNGDAWYHFITNDKAEEDGDLSLTLLVRGGRSVPE